jgi:hypothetical protein
MTPKERNEVRELAATKHKGNLEAAACDFLGLSKEFRAAGNKVPVGNDAAVGGIVDEVTQYEEIDAESTPKGESTESLDAAREAVKAAKEASHAADAATAAAKAAEDSAKAAAATASTEKRDPVA